MNSPKTEMVELTLERTRRLGEHARTQISEMPLTVDLPYHSLGGDGLERLCAALLVASGHNPRYFGERGTTDYGVDLVVSDGAVCTVYQCKNVRKYRNGDLSRWLDTFTQAWLAESPALLKPEKFVLVCPLDLRNKDDIETAKRVFFDRHGVRVEVWQKTVLDERLKRLPGVVADVFSPMVADFFCALDRRWEDGLTVPVAAAGRGARAIDRFLSLRDEAKFSSDPDDLQTRFDLLRDERVVAFVGSSGAGKTMAALEVVSFAAENGWLPWFVDMRIADSARLYESIERRAVRPSVFVLDDCHLAIDEASKLLSRFRAGGLEKRCLLVLTVTAMVAEDDATLDQGETSEFIREAIKPHQLVAIRAGNQTFRRIIAAARPNLDAIPNHTVNHLMAVTAGDLFLLDEALRTAGESESSDGSTLDGTTVETLQSKVVQRYFGERYPSATTIRRIAAVAQFDVPVPKRLVEPPPDKLKDRMLVSVGPLPAWLFTHPGLAELIYSALSVAELHSDAIQFAVDSIIALGPAEADSSQWVARISQVLPARLRLSDDSALKRRLVTDERVQRALRNAGGALPLATLSLACQVATGAGAPSAYTDLLADRLERVLSGADELSPRDLGLLNMGLRTLRIASADRFNAIMEAATPGPLLRGVAAHASLPQAMKILECVTPGFADSLIAALDTVTMAALLQRTIDGGHSVGTISFSLRELRGRDQEQRQLAAFEAKLGPYRMTRAIAERADLVAAMKIVQYVTPGFADSLIARLDTVTMDVLVRRTIEGGRSVGTLALSLRELGGRDSEQRQLAMFEAKLGPDRMARVIAERADLGPAIRILQYVTPAFADSLIARLDMVTMDVLVRRTIEGGRSVGTLALSLRELGGRDSEQRQLAMFEAKLGPDRMARVIAERADLITAIGMLRHMTPGFADSLIAALDTVTMDALLRRAIEGRRSVGTLDLSLRELGGRDREQRQLAMFEAKLGPDRMVRLIRQRADLNAAAQIVEHLTPGFADDVLAALDQEILHAWVNAAIEAKVAWIRYLPQRRRMFAHLQHHLGAADWLRLSSGCSGLGALSSIVIALDPPVRTRLLAVLSELEPSAWQAMFERTEAFGLSEFLCKAEPLLDPAARSHLESAAVGRMPGVVARSNWSQLSVARHALAASKSPSCISAEFLEHLRARANEIDLSSAPVLADFGEATSLVQVLWHERGKDSEAIADATFKLLPGHGQWPLNYKRLTSTAPLVGLAEFDEMPQHAAERLFSACTHLPNEFEIETCDAKTLVKYLTRVWAVVVARAPCGLTTLLPTQHDIFWRRLLVHVDTLARERSNEKKLDLLVLVGLLQFTSVFSQDEVESRVRGVIRGFPFLLEASEKRAAIARFFALRGLSMIGPSRFVKEDHRRLRLLNDLREYPTQTAALHIMQDAIATSPASELRDRRKR